MDARTRMKAWREALGMKKLEFARALEVWPSMVTMWESGEYKLQPQPHHIDKLCAIAAISLSRFYGRLPRPKRQRRAVA